MNLAASLRAIAAVLLASATAGAQPLPSPAPREPSAVSGREEAGEPDLPRRAPVPASRPEAEETSGESGEAATDAPPAGELACRKELGGLGARFSTRDPISEEGGCAIPHPLELKAVGSVAIEPAALLNCRTALAAARFIEEVVRPQARRRLDAEVTEIRQASAYVCRPRADGSKLSEHALGNALDIGAVALDDGREIAIRAHGPGERPQRDFIRALRGAACGPFKTVLGPGSDADHADHLHLDLAQRRNGGTWCR